jgi:hypothetical protein
MTENDLQKWLKTRPTNLQYHVTQNLNLMVSNPIMESKKSNTMEKVFLVAPNLANQCRKKTKKPAKPRAYLYFVLGSSNYQTQDYSHSMVAGGLPDTS